MILWLRLELAHWLDRAEQKLRRLGEKWGYPQAWFQEFQAYLGQPRMELWEFHVRYTLLRMDAEKLLKPTMTEAEARAFYTTHDYMLWRNLVHRRHSAWRRVLVTMPHAPGLLLEYGCGSAPIARWVASRRPYWTYAMIDLDGPARRYAAWHFRQHYDPERRRYRYAAESADAQHGVMWSGIYIITALDVFEHLADPETHARNLVERLRPGGYLHANVHFNPSANDLDLASPDQLAATERYLATHLDLVWRKDEYCVWRKRHDALARVAPAPVADPCQSVGP